MDLCLFFDFKKPRSIQQASKNMLNETMEQSRSDLVLRWPYEEAPELQKVKAPELWRRILDSIFQFWAVQNRLQTVSLSDIRFQMHFGCIWEGFRNSFEAFFE